MSCRCILLQLAEQWQAIVLALQAINTFTTCSMEQRSRAVLLGCLSLPCWRVYLLDI